jgi:alpha-glucosidase (family GH31 glycosyl hydrolase)
VIRHNPPGRGHAYRPSLDQRIPLHPLVGEQVRLGVLATPGLSALNVEIQVGGHSSVRPLRPLETVAGSSSGADGHLAAAAEAGEDTGGMDVWQVDIGAFDLGQTVRYRIADGSSGESTAWFTFAPSSWLPTGGSLHVRGEDRGRLIPGSIAWLRETDEAGTVSRVRFGLQLSASEHVVGLGERFHSLDQRGRAVDATVFEQYTNQGERTYLPVPFAHVVGGNGWGFHVDTTRRVWFDIGVKEEDELWIEAAVAPIDPELVLRLWRGEPAAVLAGFLEQYGPPAQIPPWAYRPWGSDNEWNSQARVEREVERSLAEGVPIGVVVIEAWSDEGTIWIWNDAEYQAHEDGSPHRLRDFTFPSDGLWPDPVGMVNKLHDLGVKVVLWQIPVIPDHATDVPQLIADRRVLVENGFAIREEDGRPYRNRGWWFPRALLPDFTSVEARRWWTEKRRYLDGFKTDGGEHAWGVELRFADGTRGDVSNNRFPNLYAQAFHELLHSTGTDGMTFSRAGHAGAGSFPGHWAGDERSTWEAFRASITAGLTAGASGVFAWGWDHGGFSGEVPTAELYARSAAMAALCPIMQYHAENNGHRSPSRARTPWNIAERTGDPIALDVYRKFALLRDRLVGYLVEQARLSSERSVPLMRALFFEWTDDERIWEFPRQYLLGDDLLVSPVTEPGATDWSTYLPEAEWVDAWTGSPEAGGRVVSRAVPIDEIPVYVRASAWPRLQSVFDGR